MKVPEIGYIYEFIYLDLVFYYISIFYYHIDTNGLDSQRNNQH